MTSDRREEAMSKARELGAVAGRELGKLTFPRITTDVPDCELVAEDVLNAFEEAKTLAMFGYLGEILSLRHGMMSDLDKRLGSVTLQLAEDLRRTATEPTSAAERRELDQRIEMIADSSESLEEAQEKLISLTEQLVQ